MDERIEYAGSDRTCPRCGAPLVRIRRRVIDRVISLVRPVQRYRCPELDCDWQGNLPLDQIARHEPQN